jgi:hypothetical protein
MGQNKDVNNSGIANLNDHQLPFNDFLETLKEKMNLVFTIVKMKTILVLNVAFHPLYSGKLCRSTLFLLEYQKNMVVVEV